MIMMKHRYLALFWTLVCLAGAAPDLTAQDYPPVPVTISRSQVNLNGKTYYVHIVLERQTVYGIAKAYGVTEDDLYSSNPLLTREGLKSGSVIYIPVVPKNKEPQKAEPAPAQEKPAPETGRQADKPVIADTRPAPVPNEDGFIEHTVKWFEDIYDVAREYGVTAEQIMAANGLKSRWISKRQTLRIPYTDKARESLESVVPAVPEPAPAEPERTEPAGEVPAQEVPPVVEVPVEVPVIVQPEAETTDQPAEKTAETIPDDPSDNILDWLTGKGSAELALILPFNAGGNASESNMDFYSGVLMAIHDLEKEGVKATLNVFDLQAGTPSSFDLGKNDFVLGPITASDLTTILGVTGGQVPVVSPLDQRAGDLAGTYEDFIQAPSSPNSQYTGLAAWAKDDSAPEDRIILVTEKVSEGSTAPAEGVRNALVSAGTAFTGVSWTQGEGRALPPSLTAALTKGGVNRIIVASEKEAFVGDIVRNINILLGRGYRIVMYAPSRVRTFDTIDSSLYHQCSLHICSPYFADYDTDYVKSFVRTYRALYRTEPSQFAFQGYDLTRYFASLVAKYGNRWTHALGQETSTGVHMDFRFQPVRDGSYQNTGIRRIVYNTDYSTELVR